MCGIVGYWAKESVLDFKHIDSLMIDAEKRGSNGVGIAIIDTKNKTTITYRSDKSYSQIKDDIQKMYDNQMKLNNLFFGLCRAQPETEPPSTPDDENMQPVFIKDDSREMTLIHNGAISSPCINELKQHYDFKTNIDSEAIIRSYQFYNYDIKKAIENISGGIAALMYDNLTNQLHIINTHNPLSQGYIKGYGFILHSSFEAIDKVVFNITHAKRDGMAVWEYWYHHPLSPFRIMTIDLESGFIQKIPFEPRYIHPVWKHKYTLENTKNPKTKYLVCASGGIDSGTTLAILKLLDYDIEAIHFKYGHRGEKCEEWAITNICEQLDIPLKIFDLSNIYKDIDSFSMLTNSKSEILTGSANSVKTTNAWTSGRNMVFMSLLGAYAESLILQNYYDKVFIASGMTNLSESGSYPDNSENFSSAVMSMFKIGTLCGNRIKIFQGLSNLLKSEQWYLMWKLGKLDLFKYTISCDRPYWDEIKQRAYNCDMQCGSTNLSRWAAMMAGVDDPREFHKYDDNKYIAHKPKNLKVKNLNIDSIINRILDVSESDKSKLKDMVNI